jgi:LysR family transcriptional regulator, nitrogen assimilation regulatory protein
MTVNFKTLNSFVKAVDSRSLSAAASLLHIAQPALSQQISLLETHFKRKLLIRSNVGVTPTDAGRELYRHAVMLLKQLEQAEFEVPRIANIVAGTVSVGLATYSSTSVLATPLLKRVRQAYPHVNLFINDSFGLVLSELVMSGAMDMAVIYGQPVARGVKAQPLLMEELFFIAPAGTVLPSSDHEAIALSALRDTDLLLPGRTHFLRQLIDKAFDEAGVQPRVAAESHSGRTGRHHPALGGRQHVRRVARAAGTTRGRADDPGHGVAVRAGAKPVVRLGAGGGGHPRPIGPRAGLVGPGARHP